MKNKKYNQGFSVWLIILFFAIIIAGGGYYWYQNQPKATQQENNMTDISDFENGDVIDTDSSSKECDLNKVSKITQRNHDGSVEEFLVKDGKIIYNSGYRADPLKGMDMTDLMKLATCTVDVSSWLSLRDEVGFNTEGKWFTIGTGDVEQSINLKNITENGEKLLAIEWRLRHVIGPGNPIFKAGNYISVNQHIINVGSNFVYKTTVMSAIPGIDLMLDKSIEEIGKDYPNQYQPVVYTYN